MHLPTLAQIGGDYNPDNPGDPGSAENLYTLTLKAVPTEGGSCNVTTTKVAAGATYRIIATPKTDFKFVAWIFEGDSIYEASHDITMPARSIEITAVFQYNPSNPADPSDQSVRYQLSLRAEPENSGTFKINGNNANNERLAVGSNNTLVATPNTDFVFKHWKIGDSILYTNQIPFEMPAHNVEIIGQFEYNPADPSDPNANYWNPLTGEVIIDDFTPGKLSNAISALLSRHNSSSSEVESIIVIGEMASNDFGIAKNYTNCAILDLRRVTGIKEVPSNAFNNTNLESVYLPATIERIGDKAFYQCAKLKTLTVFALTPPELGTNVFTGVPEGLVVYVPAEAIDLYRAHPIWGQFFLQPINESIRNLTVYFPSETNPADYANMKLELTNITTGQRLHYVVSEKNHYKFINLDRNSSWNVTLLNSWGDEFGHIDNIKVGEEDVTVVFPSLKIPKTVTLSVKTPEGQDVTNQANISWLNEKGEMLTRGNQIAGLPVGRKLAYSITLQSNLSTAYALPSNMFYVVNEGSNNIVCQLAEISTINLNGKVMDANTNQPINGATISATQTFAGGGTRTFTAMTDKDGCYSLNILSMPTKMTVAAQGYVSQTINPDLMTANDGEITLPDVMLQSITGAVVKIDLTYTPAHAEGEISEVQNWYSDYHNVDYEVYNKTTGQAITDFILQYPYILLQDDVNDGTVLELTATSRKEIFVPVKTDVTIAEQKATATFNIVELGKIAASFNRNENPTVIGTLYNADGKLLNTYQYKNDASLSIPNLHDGNYTLVTMGGSLFFNSIYDLAELPQTGLEQNVDYVQNTIEVKNGIISAVVINEVPTLDETMLYYTDENTSFTVNKSSIVIGNYLTLTGHLDFKPTYAGQVNNVSMIVDIPENCVFVENSVMVENSTSAYSVDGNRITIPMIRYTDRVRFCIIPTVSGNHSPSAFAQFDLNGKTITQPIGSASFIAKGMSIYVPPVYANTSIPILGTTVGQCSIDIYDNGVLIGQTTSLADGTWSADCELQNPYQMSRHNIHARIKTIQGLELLTPNAVCYYDENALQVSKVKMYHENPELHWTYEITFDYLFPSNKSEQYTTYIYNKTFSFTIEFTKNDPEVVKNVVLYVKTAKGNWIPLKANYDNQKDYWVTEGEFGDMYDRDFPVNVCVKYNYINYNLLDSAYVIGSVRNDYSNAEITNVSSGNNIVSFNIMPQDKSLSLSCVISKINKENITDYYSLLSGLGFVEMPIENSKIKFYKNDYYEIHRIEEMSDTLYVSSLFNLNSSSFNDYVSALRNNDFNNNRLICGIRKEPYNYPYNYWEYDTIPRFFDILGIGQAIDRPIEKIIEEANKRLKCTERGSQERYDIHSYIQQIRNDVLFIYTCKIIPGAGIVANLANGHLDRVQALLTDLVTGIIEYGEDYNTDEILEESIESFRQHALSCYSNLIKYYPDDCQESDSNSQGPQNNGFGEVGNNQGEPYLGADANYCIDPSGFVYEGVPSNRLQGVTATCYYKETVEDMYGDEHENVVLWDAEQYGQENPLLTDENGFYRWDVPIGMWQVKYEKEGYETTYSDWLPVPPPQLDVNIGMVQMRQPEVIKARAYPQAVEFEFDKFMFPETLTTDNITVSVNGTAVSGTIELLNAEVDDPLAITSIRRAPGTGLTFASKVRFNAARPFNADKVTLHVKQDVKSYADLQMNEDYEAVLDVELELQSIEADSTVNVVYGDSRELTVTVLPAAASKGKTLTVRSFAPMIATTDAESFTLDKNGQAVITVHGDLPGMTSLIYNIDDYDLTATSLINVKMLSEMTVAKPTASIASGSEVERGTEVYLRCATEGATIYYTLDGSCPCDNTDARIVYDGTPIIINSNITIKAMAIAEGMYDSDVATFTYRVSGGMRGDVNLDGSVNIADINLLIDYILRDKINNETLQRGDVNGDNTINIADINVVIQIILGGPGAKMPVSTTDLLHLNDLNLRPGETGLLHVTVDNAVHYSALQCDIVLPDGLTLVDVAATGAAIVKSGMVNDATSRVLTYSMSQLPFISDSQSVLTLTVRADAALSDMSDITLTGIVLADATGVAWYANDCAAQVNNASGINDLNATASRIWTEGRTLCLSGHHDSAARIISVNGITYNLDVNSGIVRRELDPGIYIVVIDGMSHKVVIR